MCVYTPCEVLHSIVNNNNNRVEYLCRNDANQALIKIGATRQVT